MLVECSAEVSGEAEEESWILLRAGLQVLLASKPSARALKASAEAATEIGLDRAARLLQGYREISGRELPQTPLINIILLLFKVGHQS